MLMDGGVVRRVLEVTPLNDRVLRVGGGRKTVSRGMERNGE